MDSPDCPYGPMLSGVGEVIAHVDPALPDDRPIFVRYEEGVCACTDGADCVHYQAYYPFCRPCGEHHRPPECPIDEQGRALSPEGAPWQDDKG